MDDVTQAQVASIFDGFNDWASVMSNFTGSEPAPDHVYLAWYGGGSYEGDAIVIYRRGTEYFINEGGHCSCYGLEGQWGPEKYDSKEHLIAALEKRNWYDSEKKGHVDTVLAQLREKSINE